MAHAVLATWQKVPVAIRAVLSGATVALVGVVAWSAFSLANQKYLIAIPWAVVPTTLFLWLFIRYLNGEGWPRATSEARRVGLRAGAPLNDTFGEAFVAGMLGIMSVPPFAAVLSRLVHLPAEAQPIRVPEGMPFFTVIVLLLMAAIVAGVLEEAAFRGYMQGPLERRYGPVVAILGTGALFGVAHFAHHPAGVIAMLPYYLYVAAVFGALAWLTNSIWPGVAVHATGDVFSFMALWITGKPEWEMTASAAPRLLWEGGADGPFFMNLAALIVLGSASIGAFIALATTTQRARSLGSQVSGPAAPSASGA